MNPIPRPRVSLSALILLALGFPFPALGQARYTVEPVRTDSLVQLRVETAFRGSPEGTTRFSLPSDRFGVSEMHRWIRDVAADGDTRLEEVEPGVYTARHEPGAEVEIAYTVAYDPEAAGFVAFGPSVGPDHFHFFGSQWMARVGEVEGPREIEVVFETEDWLGSVGSSYGVGAGPHRVDATDYDLDYSVIAGGEYRTARSTCRGRPVVTMVHGSFDVSDPEIFDLTETIVCGQREAFDDFDRPFFTVFVTERDGLTAGAPLLHGFTTFLESDTSPDEFRWLLAHEMIHTWLPRTARLVDPARPDAPEAWTRWFHEGFTEYLSRVVLVRQELAPRSWMVERTNRDLSRLTYHPYRTLTLEGLEVAAEEGRYNNYHHRLHYLRGALLALNWNARIRAESGGDRSLLDAVRDVVARAEEGGGRIGLPDFMEVLGDYGVDARRDIERHLHGGQPLEPAEDAFGPDWKLGSRSAPDFELGLDLVTLIEENRVEGLVSGGPAERAGLREDMRVVDRENGDPWRGRWDPNQPTIVVVDEDGSRRRFKVRATGATMEIPEFTPAASGDRPTLFAPGVISTVDNDDLHPTFTPDGRTEGRDTIPDGAAVTAPEIEILGKGTVSTVAPEFGASLTPDGRALYFNRASADRQELTIMVARRIGDDWGAPRVASFSGSHLDLDPFVAPDGERVWFNSDRPAPGGESGGFDIWYVDRASDGWGAPVRPPPPLNSDSVEIFVSATRQGVLYFTSTRDGPLLAYRTTPRPGGWSQPEAVSVRPEPHNPLVGPDGSFLVFTASGPDGSTDLFVTCRRDGGWSNPIHLPQPVNSPYMDFAPGLDPTDGSLLFTSERPGMAGPQPDSVRPPGDLYRSSLRPAELCRGTPGDDGPS